MQCLRKLQPRQERFPLPPFLRDSSMEERPVGEKHRAVVVTGSSGYGLVHSEGETQATQIQKGGKKKFAIPLGVHRAIWLSVLMHC